MAKEDVNAEFTLTSKNFDKINMFSIQFIVHRSVEA